MPHLVYLKAECPWSLSLCHMPGFPGPQTEDRPPPAHVQLSAGGLGIICEMGAAYALGPAPCPRLVHPSTGKKRAPCLAEHRLSVLILDAFGDKMGGRKTGTRTSPQRGSHLPVSSSPAIGTTVVSAPSREQATLLPEFKGENSRPLPLTNGPVENEQIKVSTTQDTQRCA